MRSIITISVLALYLFTMPVAEATDCEPSFVEISSTAVVVSPTGLSSTPDNWNVQCAVDYAINNEIPVVRLSKGDFFFESSIVAYGFQGTITGQSMTKTTVTSNGYGFSFWGGAPNVEKMSLTTESSAIFGAQDYSCPERATMFLTVNRVHIDSNSYGITFRGNSDCFDPLLGTLSVNRSEIHGTTTAIWISGLGGGAKLSITDNVLSSSSSSGYCLYTRKSSIALYALRNNCMTSQWAYVYFGDALLSRSDLYLSGNVADGNYDRGRLDIYDAGQRLNVVASDNQFGMVEVGSSIAGYGGGNTTASLMNNRFFTGGGWACLRGRSAELTLVGNHCSGSNNEDLVLVETDNSTINQPNWRVFAQNHPRPIQGLLINSSCTGC